MAALAPMVASSGFQMAMAGASALSTMQAGAARRRGYEAQAAEADLRGRSQAIGYKQQGADALRNMNETLAAIISR